MALPIHSLQSLVQYLLMAAGVSALVVGSVFAAFSIAAEWKREHWRNRS